MFLFNFLFMTSSVGNLRGEVCGMWVCNISPRKFSEPQNFLTAAKTEASKLPPQERVAGEFPTEASAA